MSGLFGEPFFNHCAKLQQLFRIQNAQRVNMNGQNNFPCFIAENILKIPPCENPVIPILAYQHGETKNMEIDKGNTEYSQLSSLNVKNN